MLRSSRPRGEKTFTWLFGVIDADVERARRLHRQAGAFSILDDDVRPSRLDGSTCSTREPAETT